jgi:nitroreductase
MKPSSPSPSAAETGGHRSPFEEILHQRRSVRSFLPRPVPRENVVAICEAARLAPSACNSQTWRFVAVDDPALIGRICREAMRPVVPNRWLAQAPLLIAGCSRLDIIANRLGAGVSGIEYYLIDLGIAMEHMVLRATELGLGTCWIGWFHAGRVREILGIPRRIRVSALLAVGYPAASPPAARRRKPLKEILFRNRWGENGVD